jgi:uncharacterized membrane protein
MELNGLSEAPPQKRRLMRILIAACAVVVLAYLLLLPLTPLEKADLVGYSICHRISLRSFHYGGRQLPLCARCTGTYLGVTIGFLTLALLRRWRAGEMLPTGLVIVMASFIAIMGFDGLNSYLSLFPSMPYLYTPQNWLRAATGSLNGLALSMIVWPVFNYTLWRHPQAVRPLKNAWELIAVLAVDAAAVWLVQSEPAWLLYPMALFGAGGVLWMLTLVNTMLLLILFHRDRQAETWREALIALLSGLTITLVELTVMGALRYKLTGGLDWPLAG